MGNRWHHILLPQGTVISGFESQFASMDKLYPDFIPDFSDCRTLLIVSDYSGEDSYALYHVYSYLVTSITSWHNWEQARLLIRKSMCTDGRRMSFKRLGDNHRKNALKYFLHAANELNGLSFSVAVNKRCSSLFQDLPLDITNPEFTAFRKWKPAVLRKAFFVLHTLSCLIAGLAFEGQNVFWFSDEDSIAANDQRIVELTDAFGWISSMYLETNLGHLRCGTSKSDNGTLQIEDLIAIPDVIAGAISEQLKVVATKKVLPKDVFWSDGPLFTRKTSEITWWLSHASYPLRRLICIIDPKDKSRFLMSWYHFYDR